MIKVAVRTEKGHSSTLNEITHKLSRPSEVEMRTVRRDTAGPGMK